MRLLLSALQILGLIIIRCPLHLDPYRLANEPRHRVINQHHLLKIYLALRHLVVPLLLGM